MKHPRMLAIPGLILAGALVLTGCGGKDKPDVMSPSPTESAMMDDGDMMSPSPTASDAMMGDG